MKLLKASIILFIVALLTISCFEDNDDNTVSVSQINDFVWKGMNLWYFWQQDVHDLADDRFTSNEEYASFLNSFSNPRDLFNHLKFSEDRFSWIVDDYFELINSLNGISKANGMEFGLAQISGSNNLVGFVEYILPGTDAKAKSLKRGDLFTGVNGTTITIDNYVDLLFSDVDSYTLNMAEYNGNTLESNGIDITLNKQAYTENPILIAKTFDYSGKKIGYLMYTQFINNFDEQLNNAIGNFKSESIDELVVDLRYNPGGHVSSAIHLSTMITGQFAGDLFLTQVYNDKIQSVVSEEDVSVYFPTTISGNTPINSLNLNKVYILAQGSSASASELVINCLNPYIDVIHIGDTTRGKNEFSRTILDVPSCGYLLGNGCDEEPNPNHTWGIQPLIGRNANADGFYQYTNGLSPEQNLVLEENILNLGVLGETDEPLLSKALQHISGNGKMTDLKQEEMRFKPITSSKLHTLIRDNMYIDTVPKEVMNVINR
ncbi:S41 family peptidase [Snuella lapsa]|uniref:PDZ domain-containing protein n=1 Tax=Snuella lapsa TaxID=870481 RepID=A0ABP6YHP3_9FLAO